MGKTSIQWTDESWNPVTGCKEISPGCANCYAAKLAATRLSEQPSYKGLAVIGANGHPHWTGEVRLHPDRIGEPLHWRKPRKVFVCDMSDLGHDDVPDYFIARIWATMRAAGRQTFQVLTKRIARLHRWFSRCAKWEGYITHNGEPPSSYGGEGIIVGDAANWPLPNVWLGVSVEDQQRAEERIPLLLQTPAAVRFLSCEPLLGALDLTAIPRTQAEGFMRPLDGRFRKLDWIIVGGESGPDARPCYLAWIRSILQQCHAGDVPCFIKQLGDRPIAETTDDLRTIGSGCKRLLSPKGGNMDEWPADLRVRQFPKGVGA